MPDFPKTFVVEAFSYQIDTHNRISVVKCFCHENHRYLFITENSEDNSRKVSPAVDVIDYIELRERMVALGLWRDAVVTGKI